MRTWTAIVLIVSGGLFCSSFQEEEVISGDRAKLIGDYTFICSFDQETKSDSSAFTEKYTLRITDKSELFVYRNGKKQSKYEFSNVRVPVDYPNDYVMFRRKNQYYPMFYRGDTVVIHVYPFEFQDNYFRKAIKQ